MTSRNLTHKLSPVFIRMNRLFGARKLLCILSRFCCISGGGLAVLAHWTSHSPSEITETQVLVPLSLTFNCSSILPLTLSMWYHQLGILRRYSCIQGSSFPGLPQHSTISSASTSAAELSLMSQVFPNEGPPENGVSAPEVSQPSFEKIIPGLFVATCESECHSVIRLILERFDLRSSHLTARLCKALHGEPSVTETLCHICSVEVSPGT